MAQDSQAVGLTPSDPIHGHVLSEKSKQLDRDTFVFFPTTMTPTILLFGLNQKLTPMSPVKLYRWIQTMSAGRTLPFFLCPAEIETYGIFCYYIHPNGPFLEPDSEELLPPGNYAWYEDRNCKTAKDTFLYGVEEAFKDTEKGVERLRKLYRISPDLQKSILARDSRRCRVTDSTEDVILTWIVPPPWAWAMVRSDDPPNFDSSPFLVPENIIILRKELKVHFYNHNFAVDVDDDFRIVVFRDMGAEQALLPTRLASDNSTMAEFLRVHFRATLNFMLLGGDISDTYPPGKILSMMDELGVGDDNTDDDMVPLSDERWQTELGKAILADHLQSRMLDEDSDSSAEGSGVEESTEFYEGAVGSDESDND
ncbi:hypothetical protein FB45DRAFT_1083688 [Roridomyces roridus]|uniref:HNH nuclease domain-containing protein n=1 Tax=Roridomyces roridus TaxID=1738132 RepID=A0AAD7BMG4_9AGAR|nr:hypothetical protein FB45DRAFT_1083688 [Roridomyces roridus]